MVYLVIVMITKTNDYIKIVWNERKTEKQNESIVDYFNNNNNNNKHFYGAIQLTQRLTRKTK